jgi:CheY-specific phosphatase CheX
MRAQLDEQSIIKANSQFWDQMLAMTLEPLPASETIRLAPGHVSGCIRLSGAWKGTVEVRMAEGLAHCATAAMLMMPIETVGQPETLDAAKEIVNIVAGVIKSSLPRPCSMALPESAVEPREFIPASAADSLVIFFHHAAGELMVRVCEQECLLPL